ncbi:MAG TPA: glycosyltransferase [Candidatus Acidoferrales bacterium]
MTAQNASLSVGVLVLNYNTWDLALRAVDAAIRLEGDAVHEYVLYDDGSSIPPPAGIDGRVRVIRGEINRGYTRALRLAFDATESDLIVVFDADAYPLTPFAARVREQFAGDDRLGQVAFFSEGEGGSSTESFIQGEPSKWSLLLGQRLDTLLRRRPPASPELCVFSCCMATRRGAYTQIGGIDDKFDFLDADVDYSMRLRRSGWKVSADPCLKAFHRGGAWQQLQRHRVLRFYKTRWYLLRKHHLIRNVFLARSFILARLYVEQLFLKAFGSVLFRKPEVRTEKMLGRRDVISYCRDYYR